jgi:hypothetical protein
MENIFLFTVHGLELFALSDLLKGATGIILPGNCKTKYVYLAVMSLCNVHFNPMNKPLQPAQKLGENE